MGPKYQKYIWWKKYLTTFQMVSPDYHHTHCYICFHIMFSIDRFNLLLFSHINFNCCSTSVIILEALWFTLDCTALCSCSYFRISIKRSTLKEFKLRAILNETARIIRTARLMEKFTLMDIAIRELVWYVYQIFAQHRVVIYFGKIFNFRDLINSMHFRSVSNWKST